MPPSVYFLRFEGRRSNLEITNIAGRVPAVKITAREIETQ
jgi:hypothetical protein